MARERRDQQLLKADRRQSEEEAVELLLEHAKKKILRACGKILPFGAQVVASVAAYNVGVTATQLVGFVCKVSCATPVLGTAMGLVGVGFANVLAGQASKHAHKLVTGGNPWQPDFWEPVDVDDVVLDAVLGACIFKGLGGRFTSLMPSDLSKPGALAFESIPARADNSEAYAKPSVKRELARIFRRDGCHHCGSTGGPVIGDHMPPNKIVLGEKANLNKMLQEIPGLAKVRELLGWSGRDGRSLQRFYPQCQKCSIKQATAMRNGKRVLVLHLRAPRYRSEHLSGVFVGIRHNVPPVDFPPKRSEPGRRSLTQWSPLALIAAAPADDSNPEALNSSSSSFPIMGLGMPQLKVQELAPVSWDLNMQGHTPPPTNRSPRQQLTAPAQQHQYSMSHSHHHEQQQGRQSDQMGANRAEPQLPDFCKPWPKVARQSDKMTNQLPEGRKPFLAREYAEHNDVVLLPGSAAQQLPQGAFKEKEFAERSYTVPLMIPVVPEQVKQRADSAFQKHFTSQANAR